MLGERGAFVHVAQPGAELADWLRRGHATAAIVRPDRTVMCASRDLEYLCEAAPTFMSDRRVQSNV
jgi:3-(3-hydroxy-phenyl)propionate hydroxylase